MSHILNALNRAAAERERGLDPRLHDAALLADLDDDEDDLPVPRRRVWEWVAMGAVAGLVLGLAWFMVTREAPKEVVAAAPSAPAHVVMAPVPAPEAANPVPQAAAAPPVVATPAAPMAQTPPASVSSAPTVPAVAAPPAYAAVPPAYAAPPPPRATVPVPKVVQAPRKSAADDPPPARTARPEPAEAPAEEPEPEARPARKTRATNLAAISRGAPEVVETEAADADAAPADDRVYKRDDLPANIRRQLPSVAISMSVYSQVPSKRRIFVGTESFAEGDKLAGNLVLEQIEARAAVVRFKGYRYRIEF